MEVPLFDPGAFQLLDYDPATQVKLRGDPVYDKYLKLADKRALDESYVIRVGGWGGAGQELRLSVPIKPKFEVEELWIQPAEHAQTASFAREKHYKVKGHGQRLARLQKPLGHLTALTGVGPKTHQSLLGLAREYEKREYGGWLESLEGHFAESEILV